MNIVLFIVVIMTTFSNDIDVKEQLRLQKYIQRTLPRTWDTSRKLKYSGQLAGRILIESKRFGLDPYVVTAIGRIESRYWYWVSRKGDDSHGVWQTIRSEKSTRGAAIGLAGCDYSHLGSQFWERYALYFKRKYGDKCAAQDIANARSRSGFFSIKELKNKNNIISTYVFARELRKHLDNARRFRYRYYIRGCKLSRKTQSRILRYSSYNTGHKKPRYYYMYRLCKYYLEI